MTMPESMTMVTTTSPPAAVGSELPDAVLQDADGVPHRLDDLIGDGPTVLAFVSDHCPFVRHIEHALGAVADEAAARGVSVIAVVPNDPVTYPQDGPEGMRAQVRRAGWAFPYLRDPDQSLARAVGAVCTPDLFLYGADRRLAHRGGLDASSPGNGVPVTGEHLRRALDAVLAGLPVPDGLAPSLGCSIKWSEDPEPR